MTTSAILNPTELTAEQADVIFMVSPYFEHLEDYAFDEDLGHIYYLADASTVRIAPDGSLVREGDGLDSERLAL